MGWVGVWGRGGGMGGCVRLRVLTGAGAYETRGSASSSSAEPDNRHQRKCLSHENSESTGQRQCLGRRGSDNTRQRQCVKARRQCSCKAKACVLATHAVETQDTGKPSATHWKWAHAGKAVEAHGDCRYWPRPRHSLVLTQPMNHHKSAA